MIRNECYDPGVPLLTAAEVRRIAALARLELTDGEVDRLAVELAAILDYAAQVQRVDTPPAISSEPAHATAEPPTRGVRPDVPAPSLSRAAVLENAPGADPAAGFFTVPRVLGT